MKQQLDALLFLIAIVALSIAMFYIILFGFVLGDDSEDPFGYCFHVEYPYNEWCHEQRILDSVHQILNTTK